MLVLSQVSWYALASQLWSICYALQSSSGMVVALYSLTGNMLKQFYSDFLLSFPTALLQFYHRKVTRIQDIQRQYIYSIREYYTSSWEFRYINAPCISHYFSPSIAGILYEINIELPIAICACYVIIFSMVPYCTQENRGRRCSYS